MTIWPPAATSWRLVETYPTAEIDGSAAIAVRFGADGRLKRLDRMLARAETVGNIAMAAKLLKQAANEMGGTSTNKVVLPLRLAAEQGLRCLLTG